MNFLIKPMGKLQLSYNTKSRVCGLTFLNDRPLIFKFFKYLMTGNFLTFSSHGTLNKALKLSRPVNCFYH